MREAFESKFGKILNSFIFKNYLFFFSSKVQLFFFKENSIFDEIQF